MYVALRGRSVWRRQGWPCCAPGTAHRVLFTRSTRRHALERVEVAHYNSYRPYNAAGGRSRAAAGAEAVTLGTSGSPGLGGVSEDVGGTPLSLSAGVQPARSLPHNFAALEALLFRDSGGSSSSSSNNNPSGAGMNARTYGSATHYHCVLCEEDIDPPETPRSHIGCPNRAVPYNHATREVCLDTLALLAMRGYPIDSMYEVWSDALYHHPAFSRIHGLVSPRWGIERRAAVLLQLLLTLKEANVLDLCLAPLIPEVAGRSAATSAYLQRRRVAFERLEYIGDNSWGANMAERIIVLHPDEQWAYSERLHAFNLFRDMCEMNVTLEYFFDLLQLQLLLPPAIAGRIMSGKVKADVVEALLGELHVTLFGLEPALYDDVAYVEVNGTHEEWLCALAQHCLTEMYDLIVLSMLREMCVNAVPLAKEVAARQVWLQPRPALTRNRQRRGYFGGTVSAAAAKDDNDGDEEENAIEGRCAMALRTTTIRHVPRLPALPGLCPTAQPYPRHLPHPLLALSAKKLLPCTVCNTTGEDVFRTLHASFVRLHLLSDDALRIFDRVAHPPSLARLLEQLVPAVAYRRFAQMSSPLAGAGGSDVRGAAYTSRAGPSPAPLMDAHETYFADPYYDLQATPSASLRMDAAVTHTAAALHKDTRSTARSPSSALQLARAMGYPPLQDTPSNGTRGDATAQRTVGWPVCLYAPSRLVPPNVKPPSAGVVTEHNLHRGCFAFLGYDERKNSLPPSAAALRRRQQDDTSKDNGQGGASADTAAVGEEAAVRRAVRATRLKWLHENPFFPHQQAVGGVSGAAGVMRGSAAAAS